MTEVTITQGQNDTYIIKSDDKLVPARGLEQAMTLAARLLSATNHIFGGPTVKSCVIMYDEGAGVAYSGSDVTAGLRDQAALPHATQTALPKN